MKKPYFILYTFLILISITFLISIGIYDATHSVRQVGHTEELTTWSDYTVTHLIDETVLEGTLTILNTTDNILCFYTVHQDIYVYQDDTLIYQYPAEHPDLLAKSSGYSWHFIQLPEGDNNLSMVITSPYASYKDSLPEFWVGSILMVSSNIILRNLLSFVLCIIIFSLGVCMIAYWFFVRRKAQINQNLLQLGVFAVFLSIWSINESRITTLILHNNIVCSYLAFIALMLLPLPFGFFVRDFYEEKSKSWDILFSLNVIQIAACILLQLFKIADLRETLWTTHVILTLLACFLLHYSIKLLRSRSNSRRVLIHLFCIVVCGITLTLDMVAFYFGFWDNNSFGRIGFLFYIIVLGISSTRDSAALMQRGKQADIYHQLAFTDQMTGLNNRTAFNRDFAVLSDTPEGTVIIDFDLNNLKKTNDTLGHSAGDRYIIGAAEIISNIFSSLGTCYRIGGDEFAVMISDSSSVDIVYYLSMLEQNVDAFNREHKDFVMQIAYGSAVYSPALDENLEDTYNRADQAMYENKNSKKGIRG